MFKNIEAVFFDLDGTLVDSRLDFDLMRKDLCFPKDVPILEYLDTLLDENQIKLSNEIIVEHEIKGANVSTLFDGVKEYLELLEINNIKTGILTRNCRIATDLTLKRLNISMDSVLTRECFPAKPNPAALNHLAAKYSVDVKKSIYIGDFEFDIDTAKNAGMISGLFVNKSNTHLKSKADFSFKSFRDLPHLIQFQR